MKTYLTAAISFDVALYAMFCGIVGGYWHPLVAIFLLAMTVGVGALVRLYVGESEWMDRATLKYLEAKGRTKKK